MVVIRRDPSGLVTMPPRSCVPIPAALRHRGGLLPGDPVLLTAVAAEDTLTAYSLAVVDQALAVHIPFPAHEGRRPMTITGPDARSAAPGQAVKQPEIGRQPRQAQHAKIGRRRSDGR